MTTTVESYEERMLTSKSCGNAVVKIVEQEQAACRRAFAARAFGARIAGRLIPARVAAAGADGHVGQIE
jgi:hypothetical protein